MPQQDSARPSFEQFTAVRRYGGRLTFSPDGSEIAYSTDISGQFNLWRQSSEGGYPHQLTLYADQSVRDFAWSPDGTTILYTADRQGDEFHQPYLISRRGGQPKQPISEPDVQHFLAWGDPWSPDGRWIAYAANDRERTDQDVIIRDIRSGEIRRLLAGDATYDVGVWSPDGQYLTALEFKSGTNSDVFLISVLDGAVKHLTPHEGDVKNIPGPWAGDSSGFWLLTDEGREYVGLAFFDLATGMSEWIETPEWDVEHIAASKDGRILVWTVNENGVSRMYARDTTTGHSIALPALPTGVIWNLAVSPDGGKIACSLDRPTHSDEIYVVDLARGAATQITHGFLGGLNEADLIEPELVAFPTFDDRQIPAWLYRPRGEGPFPAILSIHGGPEAQSRATYGIGLYQYWLSRGIAVLVPNIRGSTGYGKSYQKLIHRDWGGGDLNDFEACVKYLHTLPWIDKERIGVFGGSYGGFAVLSCVSRLPDYWAAAVDIVGPSNLVTMIKTGPPTWRRYDVETVGDPDTEADFLLSRSPITYADQITTPLFVIQGANDPRVPRDESDQIVERLRARGVDVRYDVYEDEGHGFTKRENDLKSYRDASEFFEKHLCGSARS